MLGKMKLVTFSFDSIYDKQYYSHHEYVYHSIAKETPVLKPVESDYNFSKLSSGISYQLDG